MRLVITVERRAASELADVSQKMNEESRSAARAESERSVESDLHRLPHSKRALQVFELSSFTKV